MCPGRRKILDCKSNADTKLESFRLYIKWYRPYGEDICGPYVADYNDIMDDSKNKVFYWGLQDTIFSEDICLTKSTKDAINECFGEEVLPYDG